MNPIFRNVFLLYENYIYDILWIDSNCQLFYTIGYLCILQSSDTDDFFSWYTKD